MFVATAVVLLSLFAGQTRPAFWVLAIVIDLALSTTWWTHGLPYGDVFTAGCDFTLCVLIYIFAANLYERWVFILYQCSMLVSIIDLGASIWAPGWLDHDTYSSALEVINYLAFVILGGVSGFAFNNRFDSRAFSAWPRFLGYRGLGQSAQRETER